MEDDFMDIRTVNAGTRSSGSGKQRNRVKAQYASRRRRLVQQWLPNKEVRVVELLFPKHCAVYHDYVFLDSKSIELRATLVV